MSQNTKAVLAHEICSAITHGKAMMGKMSERIQTEVRLKDLFGSADALKSNQVKATALLKETINPALENAGSYTGVFGLLDDFRHMSFDNKTVETLVKAYLSNFASKFDQLGSANEAHKQWRAVRQIGPWPQSTLENNGQA